MAKSKKKKRRFSPTLFDINASRFVMISAVIFISFAIIRTYELIQYFKLYSCAVSPIKYILAGYLFDLIFTLNIAGIILIPNILFFYIHKHFGEGIYILSGIFLVALTAILSVVFIFLGTPIGWDIFSSETFHLSNIFQNKTIFSIFAILLLIAVDGFLIWLLFRFRVRRTAYLVFFGVSILSLLLYFKLFPKSEYFYHEETHYITVNKGNYLIYNYLESKLQDHEDDYSYSNIRLDTKSNIFKEGSYNTISGVYPFMRKNTPTEQLGKLLSKKSNTPPNIIILLVESLGRAFSGPDAYLGSYTPNLDKLGNENLYWTHFMSASAKSFNALPSLLASLPYGPNGFMELGEDMPLHFSLINLLKENKYHSAYFSGFNAGNQNIDLFLKYQGIDTVIDYHIQNNSESLWERINNISTNIRHDDELFTEYLNYLGSEAQFPRIDIIHSSSLNIPSAFPNIESYYDRFLSNIQPATINFQKEKYKDQFACILAVDEIIGNFINELKKTPSFENTILIITGTHKMPMVPNKNRISKYHVPFLIVSPMIVNPKEFNSISTHADLAPSLTNYLRQTYHLRFPDIVHWMGSGIDLNTEFRNYHSVPLMRNRNIINELIHSDFFLSDNQVFKIGDNFQLKQLKHEENLEFLKGKLLNFREYNQYSYDNLKIISDSVYYDFLKN